MYDFEELDYYQLLGVGRDADATDIKRAYRREIAKYHPDRYARAAATEQQYAQRRSQLLTEAYSVLSDFRSRSTYNLGQRQQTTVTVSRPTPTPPPVHRDHQAELYDQAQQHLAAGRVLQAIAALRQLQQINPFYRDSAQLLASAESQLPQTTPAPTEEQGDGKQRSRWLLIGGVGVGVVAIAVAAILWRNAASPITPASAETPPSPVATLPATDVAVAIIATNAPEPTLEATAVLPSVTTAPTATSLPPSATATTAPSPTPALEQETGAIISSDAFDDDRWASLQGGGWSVGYRNAGYRITVNPGLGQIWSYRTNGVADGSFGVDVQAARGTGGLLLRFLSESSYLMFTIDPASQTFRLAQQQGDETQEIIAASSPAIRTGSAETNRIVARLQGQNIQLLANGQVLAEAALDNAPISPRYGLVAIGSDNGADVQFDNLEIRALP